MRKSPSSSNSRSKSARIAQCERQSLGQKRREEMYTHQIIRCPPSFLWAWSESRWSNWFLSRRLRLEAGPSSYGPYCMAGRPGRPDVVDLEVEALVKGGEEAGSALREVLRPVEATKGVILHPMLQQLLPGQAMVVRPKARRPEYKLGSWCRSAGAGALDRGIA